jgi:hypothetical protein
MGVSESPQNFSKDYYTHLWIFGIPHKIEELVHTFMGFLNFRKFSKNYYTHHGVFGKPSEILGIDFVECFTKFFVRRKNASYGQEIEMEMGLEMKK